MVPAKSHLGLSVNSWNSWNLYLGFHFSMETQPQHVQTQKTFTLFSGEAVR